MNRCHFAPSAANSRRGLPPEVLRACARHGVPPSRFVLVVHIARQTTTLFEKVVASSRRLDPLNHTARVARATRPSRRATGPAEPGGQSVRTNAAFDGRFSSPVPVGASPTGTGGSPVPPTGRSGYQESVHTAAPVEKARVPAGARPDYTLRKSFRCSTSKFGIGERAGSCRTPRGLHRVAEKIGGGWPAGTAFKGRKPAGFTWRGKPAAAITSRIFWLEGLEPGLNRLGQVDSHSRFIYIHGTGNEPALGRPDSHGCIHLAAHDLIPLYDRIPPGSLVWMTET